MKIDASQIDTLYGFTRQHFVEHYDLQTELVDHLANGIEEQWKKQPKKLFEEALEIEFKKFGVYGFTDIIKKRKTALTKKYYKIIFRFIKEWFQLPKLLITILITICFYLSLNSDYGINFLTVFSIAMIFLLFFVYTINYKKYKEHRLYGKKRWLFKELIFNAADVMLILFLPFQALNFYTNHEFFLDKNSLFTLMISLALTLILVSSYIVFIVLPKKAEELLLEIYPEYKFEK